MSFIFSASSLILTTTGRGKVDLMPILVPLLIFGFVIMIHEFGHFITAVKSGILVEEFAIGMGPKLFSIQGKETLYSIRLFPIGGYCKMQGEDENDIPSESENLNLDNHYANVDDSVQYDYSRSFNAKSVWARILVISGGVIMNIILAFIVFFGLSAYSGFYEPVVASVLEGYPAEEAGLQTGDKIYSIDNYKVSTQAELSLRLSDASSEDIARGEDPVIDLVYIRDGEKYQIEMPLEKDLVTGRYIIGFNLNAKSGVFGEEVVGLEKATILETAKATTNNMFFVVESTLYGLGKLFTSSNALEQVAGPIGIIGAIGETYEDSVESGGFTAAFVNMVYIMGLISANLAVFNLLPLPALDGGRLVFLFVEAITGKRVSPDKEGFIHFVGFILLLGFAVIVAASDIYKLF